MARPPSLPKCFGNALAFQHLLKVLASPCENVNAMIEDANHSYIQATIAQGNVAFMRAGPYMCKCVVGNENDTLEVRDFYVGKPLCPAPADYRHIIRVMGVSPPGGKSDGGQI